MRPKVILVSLSILILAGVAGLVFWMQTQKAGAPELTAPLSEASPLPEMLANASPTPETTASPAPSGTLDLSTDANGLSKSTVVIEMPAGKVRFKFYSTSAPNTVKRIAELVSQGFYNGLTFHRVVPDFVVQGGDPTGTGRGGSGQNLKAEFNERKHTEGAVAMARAQDPDSADSQFYIVLSPQLHLDGHYTVFAQVIEGMDVVRKIKVGDKMTSVRIE